MKHDSIIFDLDGTLWDSTEGICETWNQVLADYPEVEQKITKEKLYGCMGLQMADIAEILFPGHSRQLQTELMEKCCELENVYLAEHGGILYPDLKPVLEKLSGKYKLFVVSNCQKGYIESFFATHGTAVYFQDTECYGNTDLTKGENNRLVIERNGLKNPVYVGDTQGDADSAEFAGIPFVYAAYGFGNPEKYDYIINRFSDLLTLGL